MDHLPDHYSVITAILLAPIIVTSKVSDVIEISRIYIIIGFILVPVTIIII